MNVGCFMVLVFPQITLCGTLICEIWVRLTADFRFVSNPARNIVIIIKNYNKQYISLFL